MNEQDLRTLWVLSRVADLGSFAAAGRELGLTRAAISRLVAQTEQRLGVRLAQRSTRQVVLSERARQLVESVRPALATLGAALSSLADDDNELRGTLRIACSYALGQHVLLPLLADFSLAHPQVTLELLWSDRVEDLIGQRIDIAIRLGELPDSNLVARPVGHVALSLCAAPKLIGERDSPAMPTDLVSWPKIALRPPGVLERRPWRFVGPRGREVIELNGPVVETNSIEAAASLCLRGVGLAMLPRYLIAADLNQGRLHELLPQQTDNGPPIHVCTTQRDLLPQSVQTLLALLLPGLKRTLSKHHQTERHLNIHEGT